MKSIKPTLFTAYNRVMARASGTPPRRGRLFRLLWPLTSYLVTNLTVTVFWVLFFVLNKTTVKGREHVGTEWFFECAGETACAPFRHDR